MDFSKINELEPYDLNCNIFDVYSYDGLSMQELLCQFFTKINECVKTSNETIDLAKWLVNEGLKQEVALKLTTWLNDGTLENIINVTLFENLNKKVDNVSSQVDGITLSSVNYGLSKAHKLIADAYNNNEKVQYFMVGDSIRNANGKYIYEIVSNKLSNLGVNCTLRGHSGLSLAHWSGKTVVTQGDELARDLIPFINGDGSNTIVDISLGLNDPYLTKEELLECLQMGINIIKSSKPNTTFILTSPHKHGDIEAQKLHRDNLKYAYETMIKNNSDIGYINVFDNVFSSYTTEIGYKYMSDLLHPNELGQRAIANYIISKLIPNYLNEKVCILKGGLDKNSPNYLKIKGCSIGIELKIIKGDIPKKIILKYYKPFDRWYLCSESKGLSNISDSLPLVDEKQNIKHMEGASYNDKPIEFEGVIKITNSNLLNNMKDEGIQIEIIDCIVNEFSTIKTINEYFSDINAIYNHKYSVFNGYIDKSVPNYYKIDKVGFKINFKQTKGSPIENLRLYYYKDWDAWYLYSNDTLISSPINLTEGIQILTSGDGTTVNGEEISYIAQIEIENVDQLKQINEFIGFNIVNYKVVDIIELMTIKEHIENIYKLLNKQ